MFSRTCCEFGVGKRRGQAADPASSTKSGRVYVSETFGQLQPCIIPLPKFFALFSASWIDELVAGSQHVLCIKISSYDPAICTWNHAAALAAKPGRIFYQPRIVPCHLGMPARLEDQKGAECIVNATGDCRNTVIPQ